MERARITRYIMQMVKVVLVTVLLTLCVIVDCLPHSSTKMRQKRGFRQSIVDRMGHGFGKRANTDLYDPYLTKTPNLMTADELTTNILNSEDLAQAIVKKFIDLDEWARIFFVHTLKYGVPIGHFDLRYYYRSITFATPHPRLRNFALLPSTFYLLNSVVFCAQLDWYTSLLEKKRVPWVLGILPHCQKCHRALRWTNQMETFVTTVRGQIKIPKRQMSAHAKPVLQKPPPIKFKSAPPPEAKSNELSPLLKVVLGMFPLTAYGLAYWQWQRRKWKINLLKTIDERTAADPVPLTDLLDTADMNDLDYTKRNPLDVNPTQDPKNPRLFSNRDINAIASYLGTDPVFVDSDLESSVEGGPIGGQTNIKFNNRHMEYVLTWLSLAIGMSVLWRNQAFPRALTKRYTRTEIMIGFGKITGNDALGTK
uniref:SURF1-like protein n=1 Tax=Magallana gigas TaxID=29159 RepID=K1PI27_MAGGI